MDEEAAEQLRTLAGNPGTSRKLLDAIIDEHADCLGGEHCDICETLDELGMDLSAPLGGNPSLSPEQQERVFSSIMDADVLYAVGIFAENTNISDDLKSSVMDVDLISGSEDAYDEVSLILKSMKENPRFSKDDVKVYIKSVNDFWNRGDDWHKS
jgi:hypothetical protein